MKSLETIADIGAERIRRVGTKLTAENDAKIVSKAMRDWTLTTEIKAGKIVFSARLGKKKPIHWEEEIEDYPSDKWQRYGKILKMLAWAESANAGLTEEAARIARTASIFEEMVSKLFVELNLNPATDPNPGFLFLKLRTVAKIDERYDGLLNKLIERADLCVATADIRNLCDAMACLNNSRYTEQVMFLERAKYLSSTLARAAEAEASNG